MKYKSWLLSALLLPCLPSVAAEIMEDDRMPQEMVVTGQQTMRGMRDAIDEAQDRFLSMFNELNDNNMYDIHCYMETRPNTKIKYRTCLPEFFTDARREEAQQMLTGIPANPLTSVAGNFFPIMEKEVQALVSENPELASILNEYTETIQDYHDFRDEYFNKD